VSEQTLAVVGQESELQRALADSKLFQTLKRQLFPADTTDEEAAINIRFCIAQGLNPAAQDVYFARVQGKLKNMTSIDYLRARAEATGEYEGQTLPQFCGKDGKWSELWLAAAPLYAAKIGVYRKGWREPLQVIALYAFYVVPGSRMWTPERCSFQLAKCAEALALRKAFPKQLGHLYAPEEMEQAERTKAEPAEEKRARLMRGFEEDAEKMLRRADPPPLAAPSTETSPFAGEEKEEETFGDDDSPINQIADKGAATAGANLFRSPAPTEREDTPSAAAPPAYLPTFPAQERPGLDDKHRLGLDEKDIEAAFPDPAVEEVQIAGEMIVRFGKFKEKRVKDIFTGSVEDEQGKKFSGKHWLEWYAGQKKPYDPALQGAVKVYLAAKERE
jgi:phage recombination protein Bet